MSKEIDTRPAVAPVVGMVAETRDGRIYGPLEKNNSAFRMYYVQGVMAYDWFSDGHFLPDGVRCQKDIVALHPMPVARPWPISVQARSR